MSERGSFVTEYIHCEKCLAVMESALCVGDELLHGVRIRSWKRAGPDLPIIAGKIGGLRPGDGGNGLEEVADLVQPKLCHAVRIAVITEPSGFRARIFVPTPG